MYKVGRRKYRSIRAACLGEGLSDDDLGRVYSRLKLGYSLTDAIRSENLTKKSLKIQGKKYDSIRAAAIAHKLNPSTVYSRRKNKWSKKDTFFIPARPKSPPYYLQ